jgi:hypothetical protein
MELMRWLVAFVFIAGCIVPPHHTLSAPPADAPGDARMEAFTRLRPDKRMLLSCSGRCTSSQYLVLGDGKEIKHPEDLAPVIAPQTPAGESMRRILTLHARRRFWAKVLLIGLASGGAIAIAAATLDSRPLGIAAAGLIGGALVIGIGGMAVQGMKETLEMSTLFDSYEAGLAARLNLCARGTIVIPCESPISGQPTSLRMRDDGLIGAR